MDDCNHEQSIDFLDRAGNIACGDCGAVTFTAPRKLAPGQLTSLTFEVWERIITRVRAGVFPTIAAAEAGIPKHSWARYTDPTWRPTDPHLTAFRIELMKACAAARSEAEALIFKTKPEMWLKNGPHSRLFGSDISWQEQAKRVELSGPGGSPILLAAAETIVDLDELSDEDLEQYSGLLSRIKPKQLQAHEESDPGSFAQAPGADAIEADDAEWEPA